MSKAQCKGCKRYFSDDPMADMDGSYDMIMDTEHSLDKDGKPLRLCANCLDIWHRGLPNKDDSMNLTSHKGDQDYFNGRKSK